jgi:toxic protein SymE
MLYFWVINEREIKNKIFFRMAKKDQKQVKLQPKYRALTYGQKTVPELKLSGVWLEKLGFRAGEKVNIIIREQELIITTIK